MIYGIIAIWVLCGLLAYGQWMGSTIVEFERVLGVRLHMLIIAIINFLLGPIGLFATVFSNCAVHQKWWYKPRFQFRTSPPTDPRFR